MKRRGDVMGNAVVADRGDAGQSTALTVPESRYIDVTAGTTEDIAPSDLRTEADLDRAVSEVLAAKGDAAVGMWRLGARIASLYDSRVWVQRKRDGKAAHKTFEAFVRDELHMSAKHAHELRAVAGSYSEADVRRFGTTKLGLLLQVSTAERERLMPQLEDGVSARALGAGLRCARERRCAPPCRRARRQLGHGACAAR